MRFCRSQFLLPEENIDFFEYPILFYHIREIFQTETAGKQKSRPCEQPDSPAGGTCSFFPLLPFSGKAVRNPPFPGKTGEISLFPRFSLSFPHRKHFSLLLSSDKAPLFSISKVYTYSESPFFSPSGSFRISPEKSTVRPERTFTDAYFSFFLSFSPSFAPIRKDCSFSLYAVLSRKEFPRPVNYFFTISTAPVPGASPEKPRIFLLFRPVFFCPSDLFTVIHIFLCISPADSGRNSPISAVFPRL